jgi:6-phosphogluconolactonase
MNQRIFDTTDDLVRATAKTIEQRAAGKESVAIAISGGSTPKPLYEMLGKSPMKESLAKSRITWVVVDERYVPITDPQSNEAMIRKTLFANGVSPNHHFLRFDTSLGDPQKTADKFEAEWRTLGIESLDMILLGMGDDGHTASLFPGTDVLSVEDRIAAPVFVPRMNQWRVTLTFPVIRDADLRIVMTAGASKRTMLQQIRDGADYPIARATSGEIESWWFIDRAAAGEVDNAV